MNTVIETDRLLLRRFVLEDAEAFLPLCSRPEVIRYVQSAPVRDIEEMRQVLLDAPLRDYRVHGFGRFACIEKESGLLIGFCGVKFVEEIGEVELGYRFLPEYWGRGLATEAGRASIQFAKQRLGLERLVGLVHPGNVASARVMAKLAFLPERTARLGDMPGVDFTLFARAI